MRLGLIFAVLLAVLTSAPANATTDSERYVKSERVLRYDYHNLITNPEWIDAAANPELAEAAEELKAKRYESAVGILEPLAEDGLAKAQLLLGVVLFRGAGVEEDVEGGIRRVKQAADQGLPAAQVQLSDFYFRSGREDLGVQLLQRAAEQGLVYAQINLGFLYDWGSAGLPRDEEKSFEWFLAAAEAGEPFAMGQVAFLYYLGWGAKHDIVEAVRWGLAAADHNDPLGQHVLGLIYTAAPLGDDWEDFEKGVEWFHRAAEQNHLYSQYKLIGAYRHGNGVPKDLVTAYMWAKLADRWVSEVASEMTPEQIAEGEKRAREWLEERGMKSP